MSDQHKKLIDQLVSDAAPVKQRVLPPARIGALWFTAALSLSALVMFLLQPFRAGLLEQIQTVPLYFVEVASGFVALALLGVAMFKSAVPGESKQAMYWGLASFGIWLATILSGFITPVLEPSMVGKRAECYFEALYYSTASALPVIWLLTRRYSVNAFETAFLGALWIAMAPAFLMQLACMHEPNHALSHHLLPMLLTALVWLPVLYLIILRRKRLR